MMKPLKSAGKPLPLSENDTLTFSATGSKTAGLTATKTKANEAVHFRAVHTQAIHTFF